MMWSELVDKFNLRDSPKNCVNLHSGVELRHHYGGLTNRRKKLQYRRTGAPGQDPEVAVVEQR